MRDFEGRVAVVTGAASGIGRAIANALADAGCDLALADIDGERLAQTEAEIRQRGRHVTAHVIDVADRERMRAFPEQVAAQHGRVDILVNNAGVAVASPLEEHSIEDFEWLVGINLWGVVYGCKFFLPYLQRSDDAYIVNISSVFGIVGVPSLSSYCATKFAVHGFSESIRYELAGGPVKVMSVHPGGIRTDIVRAARYAASQAASQARVVGLFERRAMPPERAAARIVAGMRRDASRVLICAETRVADAVKRLFPVLPSTFVAKAHAWVTRS
jgi:NAD(P)-dependent dehydrogenase (short-subunit alcohol dehydrogenase family)